MQKITMYIKAMMLKRRNETSCWGLFNPIHPLPKRFLLQSYLWENILATTLGSNKVLYSLIRHQLQSSLQLLLLHCRQLRQTGKENCGNHNLITIVRQYSWRRIIEENQSHFSPKEVFNTEIGMYTREIRVVILESAMSPHAPVLNS